MEEKSVRAEFVRPKVEIPLKLRERPTQIKASSVSTPSRTSSKDDMTKDETIARLQAEVARLEKKAKRMHIKMKHVKAKYIASQNDSEAEFEFRINRLLRQTGVGQAKSHGSLPNLSTKELMTTSRSLSCEPSETNLRQPFSTTSTRSLPMPMNEEADLAKIYQAEMVVANLRQKLEDVNRQKENLESELGLASSELVNKLSTIVEKLPPKVQPAKKILIPAPKVKVKKESVETKVETGSVPEKKLPNELLTDISIGIEAVVDEKQQFLKEAKAIHEENRALSLLLNKFKNENLNLKRKIKRTTDEAMLLRLEKAHLEQNFEITSEANFNRTRKNRERTNSITSSTDSFSETSLSHLSHTHNDRERKAFMEESNKLTQDFAQRNELDRLTINSSPSFSANEPMVQIATTQSTNRTALNLEPPTINSKTRQPKLCLRSRE